VIYVIRTNRIPFMQSWPSKQLMMTTTAILLVALAVVLSPLKNYFGFGELPVIFWPILAVFIVAYLAMTYAIKKWLIGRKMVS